MKENFINNQSSITKEESRLKCAPGFPWRVVTQAYHNGAGFTSLLGPSVIHPRHLAVSLQDFQETVKGFPYASAVK